MDFNALWSKLRKIEDKTKDVDYGVTAKHLRFEWDGNTEGKEVATFMGEPFWYKVSDKTVSENSIKTREATVGLYAGGEFTEVSGVFGDLAIIENGNVFGCELSVVFCNTPGDTTVMGGATVHFPSKGVYLMSANGDWCKSVEFPEVVKPIDPKFLPDNTVDFTSVTIPAISEETKSSVVELSEEMISKLTEKTSPTVCKIRFVLMEDTVVQVDVMVSKISGDGFVWWQGTFAVEGMLYGFMIGDAGMMVWLASAIG